MISEEGIKERNKASEEMEKMAHIIELAGEETSAFAEEIDVYTSRIEVIKALAENPGPETIVQFEEIFKEVAIAILHYSAKTKEYVQQFEVHVDLLVETLPTVLNFIRNAEIEEERDAVAVLRQSTSNALESLKIWKACFRDATDIFSDFLGINGDIEDASRRVIEIIGRFVHLIGKVEVFFRKILSCKIGH